MSYTNTIDAFREAMADAGIITKEAVIPDGRLHRFNVDGDKRGTKNGAYILHADGKPAGWAMHYKTGATVRWSASGSREPMSLAMRQQIEAERAKRQIETDERHRDAADKAKFIWHRAKPIDHQSQHPYLVKKRIQPYGLRIGRDGVLLIPMFNSIRELVNLQRIYPNGDKRFLNGGKKSGCFAVIGQYEPGKHVLICEGWATGASLHDSTGHFIVVAMDKGNLEPVAIAIRGLDAKAEIIIAGDNDLDGGGQAAARKAALACGGSYLIPTTPGQDWNDTINTDTSREASNG